LLAFAAWTVDALLQLASPSDPQIRPDAGAYAYVMRGGIHVGDPRTLKAAQRIAAGRFPRWSPDSRLLAFLDKQIRIYDLVKRSVRPITNSQSLITSFSWSPDGNAVLYLAADNREEPDPVIADRDYRYTRLYWQALAGGPAKLVTKADRHVISFAISPDSTRAAYAAQPTPRNRDAFNIDLYEVDLRSGAEKILVAQPGRDADPSYSPDGRWISFHSQAGSQNYFEARHVAIVSSDGGKIRYITRAHDWDVFRNGNHFTWTSDSRGLIYTAGKGVRDFLVEHDLASDRVQVLTDGISGSASCASGGDQCVLLKTSPERPPELYLRHRRNETRLTHLQDGIARFPIIRSEVIRWQAPDGLSLEGILWFPVNYRAGSRVPLLADLHGGPTGVALHSFPIPRVYPIQVFLQRGIAVFSPNFRGSANYGAAFRLKNARSQGIGDFRDVMSGIDALVARGIADPNRLGIMGWSYGGYLTASAITQTNRFKAASIGAPATDWITYYGQSDAGPEILSTYFGGSPWEMPDSYNRHSSRSKLKDIRTPALLQVGSLDINHNGEIYRALTDHQVPVEYVIYPREGHGIREPAHVRDLLERNLRWFVKWLGTDTPASAQN
jgi:dipeptidyl aminopeptidase/acylaminoacyl peptidase